MEPKEDNKQACIDYQVMDKLVKEFIDKKMPEYLDSLEKVLKNHDIDKTW